jgi:hypothetical protein
VISLHGKVNRIETWLITRGDVVLRLLGLGLCDLMLDQCVTSEQIDSYLEPDGRSGIMPPSPASYGLARLGFTRFPLSPSLSPADEQTLPVSSIAYLAAGSRTWHSACVNAHEHHAGASRTSTVAQRQRDPMVPLFLSSSPSSPSL